ncbi:MAG: YncE family protein [Hyphomicrobiales bacterium]
MKKNYIIYISLFIVLLSFYGCKDDKNNPAPEKKSIYNFTGKKVVYIMNEGNFTNGNASLTAYLPETGDVINEIYYKVNKANLGDVAQSMTIHNNDAYLVVNNSKRVTVINPNNVEYKNKVAPLVSPRYVEIINPDKGYITDLYAKEIAVFNPKDYKQTKAIDISDPDDQSQKNHNSEQMVRYQNYIFTCSWSFDNKVLVINTDNDKWESTITVRKQPNSMVIDKNNFIWVLTDGGFKNSPYGQEKAVLQKIDPEIKEVVMTLEFNSIDDSPSELQINDKGDMLYFLNKGVHKMSVDSYALPSQPYIRESNGSLFYGLGLDPVTEDIYVADAIDYVQKGVIYHYNSSGTLVKSFKAGITPGAFCFKEN